MDDVLDYEDVFDDLESDIDSDESDDSDERARRRRRARPRTPSGQGLYRSRPSNNGVTQAQLQTALTRVGQQIKEGSTATQQLAGRVNTLVDRLDKEIASRKKADAETKKVASGSSMNMMLPLLMMQGGTEVSDKEGEKRDKLIIVQKDDQGRTVPLKLTATQELPAGNYLTADIAAPDGKTSTNIAAETVTQRTKFKSTDMMLPLVLMMSMGGMSGGSGDSNMMMPLMLIMMMQKK